MTDEQFSAAVIAYVGEPGHTYAGTALDRVVGALGDSGRGHIARIEAMLRDMHSADPSLWNDHDLRVVARQARAWLREQYPELSTSAIDAVSNQFTFDWR